MKSNDQVARVLALVPYLQAHPNSPVSRVASHLNITEQQLLKDLNVVWMCGLPGGLPGDLIEVDMEAIETDGVINLTNADYLARPLRFTPDEVFTLQTALAVVAELATGEQAEVVASVIAKLSAVAGAAGRAQLDLAPGDASVRAVVGDAIHARRRIVLTYDGASRGHTTHPRVDPVSVVMQDGVAYLRAFSLERDDWRTYRVDRIAAVELTDDPVADHGSPPPMPQTWFDQEPGARDVVLSLKPEAAWLVEYDPAEQVETAEDGGVRARFRVVDPAWLRRRLLRLADQVRQVDPPEAAATAVEFAAEAIALQQSVLAVVRETQQ